MEIKEIRELTGLNKTQFAEKYHIPFRSIQNWELGTRECPAYVLELLEFKVRYDLKNQEETKMEQKMYYLFENNEHGGHDYKKWSLEELKNYFEPCEVASAEEIETFGKIANVDDLQCYIDEYVNNNSGEHYHDYIVEQA